MYSSCVRSSMLHGSETCPVKKENEVALQRAERRMVRWMKLQGRVPSKGLTDRLALDDNFGTTAKQAAMVWACSVKRRQ